MSAFIRQTPIRYHFTPQTGRNKKSLQIQKVTQRISLLKHRLENQKRQTSLDQAHLIKINVMTESFQKKVLQQIGKCNELKLTALKTDENAFLDNLRTQNKNEISKFNQNLYNSQSLNSKTKLNSHNIPNQTLPINKLSIGNEQRIKVKEDSNQSFYASKDLGGKSMRNIGEIKKNSNFYLKETFLTSIVFILLGTVFRQIFVIV